MRRLYAFVLCTLGVGLVSCIAFAWSATLHGRIFAGLACLSLAVMAVHTLVAADALRWARRRIKRLVAERDSARESAEGGARRMAATELAVSLSKIAAERRQGMLN